MDVTKYKIVKEDTANSIDLESILKLDIRE